MRTRFNAWNFARGLSMIGRCSQKRALAHHNWAERVLGTQARYPALSIVTDRAVPWEFSGVTSGGTWIVNFRRIVSSARQAEFQWCHP